MELPVKRGTANPSESQSKKKKLQKVPATFVYFGISGIIYDEFDVSPTVSSCPVPLGEKLLKLMDDDLAIMTGVLSDKFDNSGRLFYRVEDTNIFLYHHGSHVACSKVKKTQFDQIENVDLKIRLSAQSMERHTCAYCFAFFPYLEDNDNLLKRNHDGMRSLLEDHSRMTPCSDTSPFYTPYKFYGDGRQYSKDVWSLRLVNSLNQFFFFKKFQCTTVAGRAFRSHQFDMTQLNATHIEVYFFQGSPDIRVSLSSTITHVNESADDLEAGEDSEDHDVSSENETIEGALQATKLSEKYPSKLGEVISGMYLSIQFKVLKRLLFKKKGLRYKSLSSRAFLITRGSGAFFLSLKMPIVQARGIRQLPTVVVKGIDFGNFMLTTNRLCFLFQKYLLRNTREGQQGTLSRGEIESEDEYSADDDSDEDQPSNQENEDQPSNQENEAASST